MIKLPIVIAALGVMALAPASPTAPAAHRPPARTPAVRAAQANWIFQDCLKRYKDHAGCRYLAYHKRR